MSNRGVGGGGWWREGSGGRALVGKMVATMLALGKTV